MWNKSGRPVESQGRIEQAAESLLDCFKRAVRQEVELLEVECVEERT